MAPRGNPQREELKNIAKGLTREVLSLPAQPSAEEKAAASRAKLKEIDGFIQTEERIPGVHPETFRQNASRAARFEAYVEESSPELSSKNASAEWMPRLLKRWLYNEVLTSPERTRPNSSNMVNQRGEQRGKLYMSPSTLAGYRYAAIMLLACYMIPLPSMETLLRLISEIQRFCQALEKYFDLVRVGRIASVMYSEEIRLLIEWVLGTDFVHATAADLQTALLLLFYLYTGCRTGSLLSTSSAVDHFLRWKDVKLAPDRNANGVIIGIKAEITLRHFKNHQFTSALIIRYLIGGTLKRKNLIFDLPCYLFAHAFSLGYLDGPQDLESYFSATYTASTYPIKDECVLCPVFCRGRPKGQDLDSANPLSSDSGGRLLRRAITASGLRGEEDPTITIYAARRGFLTQCYLDPNVGPEMTRILAGHAMGTWSLEKYYIKIIQDFNYVNLVGIGEHRAGPDPLYLRRATSGLVFRSVAELVTIDMKFSEYTYGEAILRASVMRGTDEWKAQEPFVRREEIFRDYDLPQLINLWTTYTSLVRSRLRQLRLLEANHQLLPSTDEAAVDYKTRAKRILENAAESHVTRDVELNALDGAINQELSTESSEDDGAEDSATHDSKFNESALDGEEGPDPHEETYEEHIVQAPNGFLVPHECREKYNFIKRLCTRPAGPRKCRECQEDPTTSEADRQRIWTPSQLRDKHLLHSEDDGPTAIYFHSPASKLVRWSKQRDMDRLEAQKAGVQLTCSLVVDKTGQPCTHSFTQKSIANEIVFKHVHEAHLGQLPDDLRVFLSTYVRYVKKKHADDTRRLQQKDDATPRDLILTHQANPSAPSHYKIVNATNQEGTDLKRYWPSMETQRLLLSRNYIHPAMQNPDLPIIPTIAIAQNDVERTLVVRLAELKRYIPVGLFEDDGYTIKVSMEPIKGMLEQIVSDPYDDLVDAAGDKLSNWLENLNLE